MNEGFTFFPSYYEAIKELDPEDQLAVFDAICRYGLYGEEPECGGIVKAVFKLVKPNLDASRKKREAGRKGGEAERKQSESTAEAEVKQTEANTKQSGSKREANGSKTEKPGSDKEKEKEKDKDIEKEKARKEKSPAATIAQLDAPVNVKAKLQGFVDMRRSIKKPMTARAVELLWAELQRLSSVPEEQCAILDQSILHSWQSVYPLKDEKAAGRAAPKKNQFNNFSLQQDYDMEAIEAAILAQGG